MKVKEIIKFIESDGWFYIGSRGSHRQYKHAFKTGRVTVSGKLNEDIHPKTKKSIYKQAKLD